MQSADRDHVIATITMQSADRYHMVATVTIQSAKPDHMVATVTIWLAGQNQADVTVIMKCPDPYHNNADVNELISDLRFLISDF